MTIGELKNKILELENNQEIDERTTILVENKGDFFIETCGVLEVKADDPGDFIVVHIQ